MTQDCIDNLIKYTDCEYEIILVDNGSSERVSEAYMSKVKYVRSEENLLFAKGCNLGAKHATGEVFCFLNNDIIVSKNWYKQCVEVLTSDETIGITGPKLLYPDHTIQHAGIEIGRIERPYLPANHRYRAKPSTYEPANELREYQAVTGAVMFIRKTDFEAVGGFDPGYTNWFEDIDLCFKVRLNLGKKIMYCPKSKTIHLETKTPRNPIVQQQHNANSYFMFMDRWESKMVLDSTKWDDYDKKTFGL
jgi:GT2 family glycosyltransferase